MTLQSVERAAVLLQLVAARSEPVGAADAAAALGIARSSAHQLLRTLADVGFLERDDATGRYLIGAGALRLAHGPVDTNLLRSLTTNLVDALAARSGESAYIGVLRGDEVELVHHVFRPDDSRQQLEVGRRHPARSSALGQVLLALDPAGPAVLRTLVTAASVQGAADGDGLGERITQVRRRQWACTVGAATPDRFEVAAPLRGRGGTVVAAVGVVGAAHQVADPRGRPLPALLDQVLTAAAAISVELAGSL